MALDSFLKGKTAKDEIIREALEKALPQEDAFITLSRKTPFSDEYSLRVGAAMRGEMSHSLVELSFQYIAKVLTAVYCNDENTNPIENSPAHRSIENLKWRLNSEYYSELKERFDYAEMRIFDYIDNGNDSTYNIIQHCFFLAKLDVCYKRGAVPSDLGQFFVPANDDEVTEIKELALCFKRKFLPHVLTPTSRVVFNPSFGFGESLMGESDCQMIIDNTIIDLRADFTHDFPAYKVAKNLGYYMMTLLNREFDVRKGGYKIDNLVFYSGRFGETEILSLEEMREVLDTALDKIILATEARYKYKSFEDVPAERQTMPPRTSSEGFLDEYEDRERKDYNDGYKQVVHKKHHYFRNTMIFIIIVSLLIVAFYYGKDWYVSNYGNDFSVDNIIKNIFG